MHLEAGFDWSVMYRLLARLRHAQRALSRRFDLQQRQPRVIEKYSSGIGKRHATRLALQQLHAN
jgi:hypothetical protein